MSKRTYYQDQRPQNGCARCEWWKQHREDNWGYCYQYREKTWWEQGPCVEYELKPDTPNEIRLIDMRDEVYDGNRH